MACGLTIIFGLLDVVNFAHGTFYMLGAFATFVIVSLFGNFWLGLASAVIIVRLDRVDHGNVSYRFPLRQGSLYPLMLTFDFPLPRPT
jgi:branched-subunit amino acid ABC-type transport system permease component